MNEMIERVARVIAGTLAHQVAISGGKITNEVLDACAWQVILEVLDAVAAPSLPSGVVASLRTRRKVLRERADGFGPFLLKDAFELGKIGRVLDSLDRKVSHDAA